MIALIHDPVEIKRIVDHLNQEWQSASRAQGVLSELSSDILAAPPLWPWRPRKLLSVFPVSSPAAVAEPTS